MSNKWAMTQELTIIDIGAGGDGIARLDDGRTVFVPFSCAGDVVDAVIEKDGQALRGRIKSIVKAGDDRVDAPCRHFGICGGCSLQHIGEDAYSDFKKREVLSTLEKSGINIPRNVESVFIPKATRRRANFAARVVKGKALIGFHERKSANIRDVPDCQLISDDVRDVMERFRPFVAQLVGEGQKLDILIQCVDGVSEVALTGKLASGWEAQQALADALRACDLARISLRARDYEVYEIQLEAKAFYKRCESLLVKLAAGAFLQPSAEGEAALVDAVLKGVGDASCAADLFCGNGTFTGPLMGGGRKVIAADNAEDAIDALKAAGVDARSRNLFKEPMSVKELDGVDCVVLDPPRAGALEQVRELAGSDIARIVYVSCNPQSFARDAAVLADGDYVLERLTIVDQFIWSTHTEIVGVFQKDAW